MKTFVLVMALFAPDGSKTEIPVDLWQFRSLAQCTQSAVLMNTGRKASTHSYSCAETKRAVKVATNFH